MSLNLQNACYHMFVADLPNSLYVIEQLERHGQRYSSAVRIITVKVFTKV